MKTSSTSTEKQKQSEELERQMARFKTVYGGEVVTYAAQPAPERKPWRKRKSLLDEAFDKVVEEAEKDSAARIKS